MLDLFVIYKLYITPLRHERMRKWLNLDSTRGAALREGRIGGPCQRRDYLKKEVRFTPDMVLKHS